MLTYFLGLYKMRPASVRPVLCGDSATDLRVKGPLPAHYCEALLLKYGQSWLEREKIKCMADFRRETSQSYSEMLPRN